MTDRLLQTLCTWDALERSDHASSLLGRFDGRAKVLVAAVYLVSMLSVPAERFSELLLFALFPILAAGAGGLSYASVARRSLVVLPFVAFIGIFNLFYDREPVFVVGHVVFTRGALTFASILLRGLLSVQTVIILVSVTGFYRLCRSLQWLGVPSLFTTQLIFVYRYLYVLVEEALAMRRACDARSFGRRSYPLKVWGCLVGQLLLRTFDRAERIGCAMAARGFTGRFPDGLCAPPVWGVRDSLFLLFGCAAPVLLRLFLPVETLSVLFRG